MKRLVVIADSSLIVQAVRLGLRGAQGFEVLSYLCRPGADATRVVDAAPDAVLVDDMNESDHAITFIRELKELDPGLVVMVLTVRVRSGWTGQALAAGASAAISKSIQPLVLGTLVSESLKRNIIHAPGTIVVGGAKRLGTPRVEPECLTDRELEILRLVAAGHTNGVIARKLWVAEATVKFHLRNIYRKLDLGNRTEVCHYAHVNGLLAPASRELDHAEELSTVS